MVIRQAKKSDISILLTIIRDSFKEVAKRFDLTVENCPRYVAFYTEERLISDFEKGMKYYILYEDGRPCGCIAIEEASPDLCYLGRLAVLPEYRNKGFGRALVNHVFEQAEKIGFKRIEIGMISKDKKLKNWYRRFGFENKGKKKFDQFPFIVAFMYKELNRKQ
jgi:N-acetylglutamate synthase-like GNAT family acetyltransferase